MNHIRIIILYESFAKDFYSLRIYINLQKAVARGLAVGSARGPAQNFLGKNEALLCKGRG